MRGIYVLILLFLCVLSGCSVSLDDPTIVIYNTTSDAYSFSSIGFSNVPQSDNIRLPRAEYLDTLSPKVFRNSVQYADNVDFRVLQMGAAHQVVLNAAYDTTRDVFPGDGGSWSLWDQYLQDHISQDRIYHIEIWDKPDVTWQRSQDQFMDMWERSYASIKSLSERAVIMGPGLSMYDSEQMFAFLGEAQRRGVLPDIISWHEQHPSAEHIEEVRSYLSSQEISKLIAISTYGDQDDTPAQVLNDILALESSDVYAATRFCEDCAMGGLLVDGKQTPLWWVYKAYADLQGRSVQASKDIIGTTDGAGFYLLLTSDRSDVVVHFEDIEDPPLASLYKIPSNQQILDQPQAIEFSTEFVDDTFRIGWVNDDLESVYLLRVLRQSTR